MTVQNGWDGNTGNIDYGSCGIVLNSGRMIMDGYFRLDQDYGIITINGGYFQVARSSRAMQMGDANTPTKGGQFIVNGGTLRIGSGGMGRNFWTRPGGQFVIKNDGKVEIVGNYTSWQQYINSGYLNGGDDFSVILSYDALDNLTTFSALPSSSFLLSNPDRQVITAGTSGSQVNLLATKRVANSKSLTWKYRKQGEVTYNEFDPAQTGTSCVPAFNQSGVYYVACEGVDENDVTVLSDEVEIFVGSDKIAIAPYFVSQYIRANQPLFDLAATFTGEASDIEWKYSTTPSGPYMSFDPAGTTAIFSPLFGSTGLHYVVVEATIDGAMQRSSELMYIVEGGSTTGKWLDWTAAYGTDFHYGANYSPAAVHFKNSINIPAGVTPPVIDQAGNDSIAALTIADGQTLTLEKPDGDVLNIRGEVLVYGTLYLKSGTVDHTTSYFRIPNNGDLMVMSGNSELKTVSLLIGNKAENPNEGGILELRDNARFYNTAGLPLRFSIDEGVDESLIRIYDKAQFLIKGDVRETVKDLAESKFKIQAPAENHVPYYFYDKATDYTIVKARNTTTFSIQNDAVQYTGVDVPVGDGLMVENVDGVNTLAWYWGTSPLGPWSKFEGSDNVVPFAPQFSESGTYYVVAIADGNIESSNTARIEVVGLAISPASQYVLPNTDGTPLTYTLSDGVTMSESPGAWYDVTNGTEIVLSNASSYTPNFSALGTYQIVFAAEVKDEYSNTYMVVSNVATVDVVSELPTSVNKPKAGGLVIYPNPSSGTFYVSGTSDATVEVVDAKGALVLKKAITSSGQTISVSAKGVYLVRVVDGSSVKVGRIIVK
ncbi:MAG: T9SS type A sorting domain-containing protein [Breznakibacter sp.]